MQNFVSLIFIWPLFPANILVHKLHNCYTNEGRTIATCDFSHPAFSIFTADLKNFMRVIIDKQFTHISTAQPSLGSRRCCSAGRAQNVSGVDIINLDSLTWTWCTESKYLRSNNQKYILTIKMIKRRFQQVFFMLDNTKP